MPLSPTFETLALYVPVDTGPPGPEATRRMEIQEKETVEAVVDDVVANPIAAPAEPEIREGRLVVLAFPWAEIQWGDRLLGTTPLKEPIEFPPGEYDIVLRNPGFPDYVRHVSIHEDSVTQVRVDFWKEFSALSLSVTPWAYVAIDDSLYGATPLGRLIPLRPGPHRLSLRNDQGETIHTQVLETRAGETLHVRVKL
jgi:hypothetical protein